MGIRSVSMDYGQRTSGATCRSGTADGRKKRGYYTSEGYFTWIDHWIKEARVDSHLHGCMEAISRDADPASQLRQLTKSTSANVADFAKGLTAQLPSLIDRHYKISNKLHPEYLDRRNETISKILAAIPS